MLLAIFMGTVQACPHAGSNRCCFVCEMSFTSIRNSDSSPSIPLIGHAGKLDALWVLGHERKNREGCHSLLNLEVVHAESYFGKSSIPACQVLEVSMMQPWTSWWMESRLIISSMDTSRTIRPCFLDVRSALFPATRRSWPRSRSCGWNLVKILQWSS